MTCIHENHRKGYYASFIKETPTEELETRALHFKRDPGWKAGGTYARLAYMQVYRQMSLAELRRRLGS